MLQTDICILGGGIMGCSTAYWASRLSKDRILVIDRYGVGNQHSSSSDINRVFRFSYGGDETYTRMAEKSLAYWQELEEQSGEELLVRTGLLMINGEDESANKFNKTSYDTLTRLGLGAEEINGRDMKLRFPQFNGDHAYFDTHGGVLFAAKSLSVMKQFSENKGVEFMTGKATKIVNNESPHVILDTGQEIRTRKLIVTVGPWSNIILRPDLPEMFPTRQQLIYFQPNGRLDAYRPLSFPVFFTDHHYGLPAAGIDAVKVSPKELTEECDPDHSRESVDGEQVESCMNVCRQYVPGLAESKVTHSRVCFYDMTRNTDFVIDKDPENNNVVYGYGFSGHGFKFASLIGKLLTELSFDQEPSFDLNRFTADSGERRSMHRGQLGQGE